MENLSCLPPGVIIAVCEVLWVGKVAVADGLRNSDVFDLHTHALFDELRANLSRGHRLKVSPVSKRDAVYKTRQCQGSRSAQTERRVRDEASMRPEAYDGREDSETQICDHVITGSVVGVNLAVRNPGECR